MYKGNCTSGLCSVALGVAVGVMSGLCMMVMAWGAMYGYGVPIVTLWSTIYMGYAPTFVGGLIGFAWGLLDGFIAGVIIAWVYNGILCCCRACSKCSCSTKDAGPRVP